MLNSDKSIGHDSMVLLRDFNEDLDNRQDGEAGLETSSTNAAGLTPLGADAGERQDTKCIVPYSAPDFLS